MKVYVDELPIKVRQSVIHYDDGKTNCLILEFSEDVEPSEICEIKALKQQVRKEVCEEIKDLAGNYFELPYCDNCGETSNDDVILTGNDLTEILDQIQGEK